MKRRSLEFLLRVGLGLTVSLALLSLLLWVPHAFPVATALDSPSIGQDAQVVRASASAAPVGTILDQAASTLPADSALAAVAPAAQTVENDMAAWRAWQQLSPKRQAKVDSRILAELRGDVIPAHLGGDPAQNIVRPQKVVPLEKTRFFVYLHDQPDLSQLQQLVFASQADQRTALLQLLRTTAETQQAPLRALLDQRLQAAAVGGYQPFYIVNAIALEGDLEMVVELAQRADVARLVANYPLLTVAPPATTAAENPNPQPATDAVTASDAQLVQWNINLVNADHVWDELGVRGQGAVVAGFDTGVDYRHPALVNQYRGNLGNNRFDHNYNWFEPDGELYPNGDLGPSVSDEPGTCSSHGTHTMGTMVGDAGTPNTQVGMAPGAQWIALPGICGNTMDGGISDDIGGLKAFQWVLCPTDLSGDLDTADCSKAPDAVNNSWGSANPVTDLFRPIIRTLRAANIAPVFAAGNPYADAGSIGTPANAPEAITVGATDSSDVVAYFSGRGPSYYPGEQKPEFSAPGVSVNSAIGTSSYGTASGTSMAAPHVAGLIALMVSADLQDGVRDFTIDELEQFMIRTAVDLGKPGPDNDYGFGRIDAYNAVNAVLQAGDLRGLIRDAVSDQPLRNVQVAGRSGTATFAAATGAQGTYSLTVPAGIYNLTVNAWGYPERQFAGQFVVAGAQSIADFALTPLPRVTVNGNVSAGEVSIAGARIYVAASPTVSTTTGADGSYTLSLPVGTHTLVVEKSGYHVKRQPVTLNQVGSPIGNITLAPAPTILLIEADAYRGWFDGWPIDLFFRTALDEYAYLYARWPIQDPEVEDTFAQADGSTGYGLPTLATLNQYDVVIWIQSGCSAGGFGCYFSNSPTALGMSDTLAAYMDGGGRIIFSGQDLGFWEDGGTLFTNYLYTSLLDEDAAGEGDSLTGVGFLDSIQLTVTNASLYGHSNGIVSLAPDAISAVRPLANDNISDPDAYDVDVFPILQYDHSQLPAAVAVDACSADYRAVYFGVGYENIAQRAEIRNPAITATLDKSIAWVNGTRQPVAFDLVATEPLRFAPAGETVVHEVRLVNRGTRPLSIAVAEINTQWPATLYIGDDPAPDTIALQPCQAIRLALRVAVPAATIDGSRDPFTLTVTATPAGTGGQPVLTRAVGLTSGAFVNWEQAPALATARHQLGVATLPAEGASGAATLLYALGGWRNAVPSFAYDYEVATTLNSRFNSCSNSWEPMADLPAPRAGMAVTTLNGEIYAIGGGSQRYQYYLSIVESHNNLWRYQPATDSWTELAPLPVSLVGATAAAFNGKIYLFGGMAIGYVIVEDFGLGDLIGNTINRTTYIYDPATNSWSTGASLPDDGRFFAAAVPVGSELMVAGGWPNLDLVHFYNPATDSWRAGPSMVQGRHSFGLAAAADDTIYAAGGGVEREGTDIAERYVPTTGTWETIPMLLNENRYGMAAGYVGGRLVAVGGTGAIVASESLAVGDSFCLSTARAVNGAQAVEAPVAYEIVLHGDTTDLPAAQFQHQLPAGTRFAGFAANPIGARYDAALHTVVWQGALPAKRLLAPVRYTVVSEEVLVQATSNVRAAVGQATPGTLLSSTVQFDGGNGVTFARPANVLLLATDIDASSKEVAQEVTRSGDRLTYTVTIQGNNFINRDVVLRDPLPASVSYVPDSLRVSAGSGRYDAATHTVEWAGSTTAPENAFINLTDNYQWGDSDGRGEVGAVPYRWTDIADTGTAVGGGDVVYYCDLPVGFAFPFYDRAESQFCVSTNGFLSFDRSGYYMDYNSCPLPNPEENHSIIAVVWDDLVIYDSIYYQTFGTAPNRYLIVQWSGVRRYASYDMQTAEFQAVLFENGIIHFFINDLGGLRDLYSTTGLEDATEQKGVTYGCNQAGTLHSKQAIAFIPPNTTVGAARAEIQFQAIAGTGLEEGNPTVQGNGEIGINVPVTNTVFITLAEKGLARQATTLLNPLDLSSTTFAADRAEVTPDEVAVYALTLRNDGLIAADNATVAIKLPAPLAYETDSLQCARGSCAPQADGTLQWTGPITPQLPTTVTFAARLTEGLRDRTRLTTTATVDDGYGTTHTLTAELLARRSDLSQTQFAFMPRFGEPGYKVVVLALLQNVGALATDGEATITLPAALTYVEDSLICGTGTCTIAETGPTNLVVKWQGRLGARQLIPLRLQVQIPPDAAYGDAFNATLAFNDMDWADTFSYESTVQAMNIIILPTINGDVQQMLLYLPLVIQD
ncbi:MAG: S8 family serine peptidase [Caldilineaceae bacterium]|nr:S8 family serine peptidase [Caldilineaceae bacterium]